MTAPFPEEANPPHSPFRSPLRILHAIFSSRIAGSERYCIDLANRQAALGHEVHVVGRAGSPLSAALAADVHFHGVGRFFAHWQLRRIISRVSPGICHGHLSAACKALATVATSGRRVATLHVGYKPHQHAKLDGLIGVNRAQLMRMEHYRGLARVIPNWLPAPLAASGARGLRAELAIGPSTFVIGSVGRLHPSKGTDVLIKAFRAAAPASAALVIIGEGPQRAELARHCAGDPRIHLVGYRDDVHACLHGFDLFVSPSREESFGLAIIEAMSAGLPVIASAAEGPAEYLLDQPVTLVTPGDVTALAAAIREAAGRFRAGQLTSVHYDLRCFDPHARVANVIDFYGLVLANRSSIPAREWIPAAAAS